MKKAILCLLAVSAMTGAAAAATWTVDAGGGGDFTTVEAALAGVGPGDTININAGVYNPVGTLSITQSVSIFGAGEGLVTINIPAAGGYGFSVGASNVTLEGFTLAANAGNENYPIHASGTPAAPAGYSNLTIRYVTISGSHRRAGFDIHGYDTVVLSHLTSSDAYGGNGLQLTGVVNATVDNITTSNNAWGSIAIYCSQYMPRASSGIVIDGDSCSLGEGNLFSEDEFGLVSTGIVINGYEYIVRNLVYRTGAEGFKHYQDTLPDAVAFALGLDGVVPGSFILPIAGGAPVVAAGMLIQPAIDAAAPGDVIAIPAGTFREQLYIDKNLGLSGAGIGATVIEAPDAVDRTTFATTTWTGSGRTIDAVIGAVGATVDISGLSVDGRDTGPDNFYGIYYHECSGSVTACEVDGITYPAQPGAQRVLSMGFSHGAATGPFTVDITDNVIPVIQKGGIYVGGPEMVFTVERNQVTANPTPSIAGNGIQLSYGATGTTDGNTVTGVGYTGTGWAGTGILLFESGDVVMNGDTVTGSQSGVNYSDWRWVYNSPVPVNLTFNGLTLTDNEWSFGAQLSGEQSDLNLVMNGGAITGSTGDAVDIWGTDLDPWGGSYYTGWNNGDLDVSIDGLVVDNTAIDGIWTDDLSGNATNTVHGFTVRNSSFTATANHAVANGFPETIDAAENYWDDPYGPVVVTTKALDSRASAPLAAPAGFDLPDKAAGASVPTATAEKSAANISGPVIFSPWYGSPFGSSPMTLGTNGTIQSAIDLANSGDTIHVTAGSYGESITLNKALTLLGANAGVHPAVGTHPTETVGARGPETVMTNGFPAFVPAADDITIDGFKFTGSGGRIIDTYTDADRFHLTNCIFDNGAVATTQGVIQFGGGSHVDLTLDFNLFMDKGDHTFYTGGGPFDRMNISWNLFNVEGDALFWTATPLVDGVIQGNELDGTIGGVPGAGGCTFNAGQLGNVQILDNWAHDVFYTPFQVGIIGGSVSGNVFERIHAYPGYWGSCFELWGGQYGTAVSQNVSVTDNVFHINDVPGAAEPSHGLRVRAPDTGGTGVDGTTIVLRDNQFIDGGVRSDALAVWHQGDSTKWVDAIGNDWGDLSGPYHLTLNPSGTGAPVGDYVTFSPWSGMASASALPAASGPINCAGSVTIVFGYTPDTITPDMFLYNAVVRATSEVAFSAVADLYPFGTVNNNFYAMDNGDGSWTITGSTVGSPSSPVTGPADLFSITFAPVSDGIADVTVESLVLRDPDNNTIPVNLPSATIEVDCTLPAAVTGIAAAPAHNKVNVSWTHDGTDVAYYEVYRGLWYDTTYGSSAYPEYDDLPGDVIPTRPANRTDAYDSDEWVLAGTVAVGANTFADTWTDHLNRGVYYYEVFPVDAAVNYGPTAAANDRATNYWLGDLDQSPGGSTPDGEVDAFDINLLGTAFGTSQGDYYYDPLVDVGPTDDWSRLGIPTTDSVINFEDLMVFAMNFGVVTSAKAAVPASTAVQLAWVRLDDGSAALRLVEGDGLKGVRVAAPVAVASVKAGELSDEQSGGTFVANVGDQLDASAAVLGVGARFVGAGDLLVVEGGAGIELDKITITARGIDNSELDVELLEKSDTVLPRVFALHDNCPNPFNPKTTIRFALPTRQHVRLSIYGVDGRLVATLLDETRSAGTHEVVWSGRDAAGRGAASGTYFYRLDAGPYSDVRKMTLMK